ncbi:MAG: glycosyltransferase [Acidobacteria bacterium]|nr:glycosyltransferase [Acidobacteriota bacterium]
MRLGYHAPMPPAPTGVADYARRLLEALRSLCDPVVDADRADAHLYQLGNNQLHLAIHERALRTPGFVLLHDACLHHFYLGALGRREYVAEFCSQYGAWHRGFAGKLWEGRAQSAADERYFRYPMLKRVVEAARAVLVHNAAAAAAVRRQCPQAAVFVIPHLFDQPRVAADDSLRTRWGLAGEQFLFGVFGHLRQTKRLGSVLRAFGRASRRAPQMRLLVAGQFVSPELKAFYAPLLEQAGVIRLPHLDEEEFWRSTHAVDACVNLRYPSCGETSGITIRLMGIGKPVLLSSGEETACFPEGSCVPVESGAVQEAMLEELMVWLATDRGAAEHIGARARRHIERHHSPERAARAVFEAVTIGCL